MQIFFNVHFIVDSVVWSYISFTVKELLNFVPSVLLMFKPVCFHRKLVTSLASHPFAQECSFAHDKKLFLSLKQS